MTEFERWVLKWLAWVVVGTGVMWFLNATGILHQAIEKRGFGL